MAKALFSRDIRFIQRFHSLDIMADDRRGFISTTISGTL